MVERVGRKKRCKESIEPSHHVHCLLFHEHPHSNYELDHPQVYYTSTAFEIKANGTQPANVQANTNATPDDNSATQTSAGASPDATLSASGNEETQSTTADKATTNSAHSLVVKQSILTLAMAAVAPLALDF